jgi:hypothetical protein
MFHKKSIAIVASVVLLIGLAIVMSSLYTSQDGTMQTAPIDSQSRQAYDSTSTNGRASADTDRQKEAEKNNQPAADLDWMLLRDAHENLGLKWDNFTVNLDLSNCDRSEIRDYIDKFAVTGTPVDEENVNRLKALFVELAYSYGREDFSVWLDYLRKSGHTVSEERLKGRRDWLITEGQISEDKIATDGWDLLKQIAVVFDKKSRWKGLSLDGNPCITCFRVTGDAPMPTPGEVIQTLRNYKYAFTASTSPPVSMEQIFADKKEVLFSDVTFFVLHSDEGGGRIQPYVMRSWYDPVNERWRPFTLTYFPENTEKLQTNRIPMF